MIKALFFDIDGTLVSLGPIVFRSLQFRRCMRLKMPG